MSIGQRQEELSLEDCPEFRWSCFLTQEFLSIQQNRDDPQLRGGGEGYFPGVRISGRILKKHALMNRAKGFATGVLVDVKQEA